TAGGSHRATPPGLRPTPAGVGDLTASGDPPAVGGGLDGQRRSARPAGTQAPAPEGGPNGADPARPRAPAAVARHRVRRSPRRATVPHAARRARPGHRLWRGVGGGPRACAHACPVRVIAGEASL